MTAHIDALDLQRTLDAYFDTLTMGGKPLPATTTVKKEQLSAWLRTFGDTTYRGVRLEAIPERKRGRRKDTINWVQQEERAAS